MPLQDRFLFRFGFILTVIISLILVNPCQAFAGDATQVFLEYDPDEWEDVSLNEEEGKKIRQRYADGRVVQDIRISAERGDADAQFSLGFMYASGKGVQQDYQEAVKWYQKAAVQGLAEAQYNVALMYSKGKDVVRDYRKAFKWFRKAAEQGFAQAQLALGIMYDNGYGIPQDCKKAAQCYRKAAEQGSASAQHTLGFMYSSGKGVSQDYREAVKWYQKAAEQGDASAQCNLGTVYNLGQGVSQDYKKAVKWFRKAAEQENAMAQAKLGVMFEDGRGVPQNYIRAYAWYNLAAFHDAEYAEVRDDLASIFMTPQQIASAQELSAELQAEIEKKSKAATSETEKSQIKGTGTGFLVTWDGYILTCYHVIEKAGSVRIIVGDKTYAADIEQVDSHNDLALLKISGFFPALTFSPARSAKLGESIFTIGYPNPVLQGQAAKFTRGEISSLTGYRDAPRLYQISAPVQPGNSGGALVDEKGHVVGVVVAILDARAALEITGALPQNVNYAIKRAYVLAFLDALPEVSRKLIRPEKNPKKSFEKIVDHVKKCTVMIVTY